MVTPTPVLQSKSSLSTWKTKRPQGGELTTNRQEDQEIALLCLHLLQSSLVYINTLMIQQVLEDPAWLNKMTARDRAALSPLFTNHVNPFGRFDLDLETRIQFGSAAVL